MLSLGAGRQSTALYLMACDGVFGDRPDVAIFADTKDEPKAVYAHVEVLERDFGHVIPIHRIGKEVGLSEAALRSYAEDRRFASIPLHVRNTKGKRAMLRRQCTREFKVEPIEQECRRLLGLKKGQRVPKGVWVESWQGISLDEAVMRMKDNRRHWAKNRYPLVFEEPMTVTDCVAYNLARGYPAPKSACVFCPYTDDARWRDMKANRPEEFAAAVEFDATVRVTRLRGERHAAYVHDSLQPLGEVDFSTAEEKGQANMFENVCDGPCET